MSIVLELLESFFAELELRFVILVNVTLRGQIMILGLESFGLGSMESWILKEYMSMIYDELFPESE